MFRSKSRSDPLRCEVLGIFEDGLFHVCRLTFKRWNVVDGDAEGRSPAGKSFSTFCSVSGLKVAVPREHSWEAARQETLVDKFCHTPCFSLELVIIAFLLAGRAFPVILLDPLPLFSEASSPPQGEAVRSVGLTASILAFAAWRTETMSALEQKKRCVNVESDGAETKELPVSTKMRDHSARASVCTFTSVGHSAEHMLCRESVWLCNDSVYDFAPLPLLTIAGGCGGTSVEEGGVAKVKNSLRVPQSPQKSQKWHQKRSKRVKSTHKKTAQNHVNLHKSA